MIESLRNHLSSDLLYILVFISIIAATFLLAYLVNRFFRRLIRRSTEIMKNDPTNYLFLRHATVGMIYVAGFATAIYMMPNLRTLASSLLAGAGIAAVSIGFASQHALSNIISGVFIVIFKPFRINDRLQIREMAGFVEDITLRHTVIRDFLNNRIIIPNAIISDEVIVNSNYKEDQKICKWVDVGISYDSDLLKAKSIVRDEILNHPLNVDPRTPQQISEGVELAPVRVIALAESSVNLRGWAWAIDSANAFQLNCDLLESIKLRFDREGIEIPFPHRTIIHKNRRDENLNQIL